MVLRAALYLILLIIFTSHKFFMYLPEEEGFVLGITQICSGAQSCLEKRICFEKQ